MENIVALDEENYLEIISSNGLLAEEVGYSYQVGALPEKGWSIHVSVITSEVEALLMILVPFLKEKGVSFKIPIGMSDAIYICGGQYGSENIGKVISVYPVNDQEALEIAISLIAMTDRYNGPKVPSGFHLGGMVYVTADRFLTAEALKEDGNKGAFVMPDKVAWPFSSITPPVLDPLPRKLNGKYIAFDILKDDPKGRVVKAIRRRHLFDFKWVIVKIGNQHMCSDKSKHDIRTRLQWQQQAAIQLYKQVRTPEVYEYFEINGDGYLIMEYIKGQPLKDFIKQYYEGGTWTDLNAGIQLKIMEKMLEVLRIVAKIHSLGFVHRDLTTMNFILERKGICVLDLELIYSLKDAYPTPAFSMGSPGYMSPEQEARDVPTVKEDIYALGALLQRFFTGLDPVRLKSYLRHEIEEKMFFFINDRGIAGVIAACLDADPLQRPTIQQIEQQIMAYFERIRNGKGDTLLVTPPVDNKILYDLIRSGIRSFGKFFNNHGYWTSKDQTRLNLTPIEEGTDVIYGGFNHGASGILYMLSRAKSVGFEIGARQEIVDRSWNFIAENFLQLGDQRDPGLSEGMAGIALGAMESYKHGLLPKEWDIEGLLSICFQVIPGGVDLFNGRAGQGIAALLIAGKFTSVLEIMPELTRLILEAQTEEGGWLAKTDVKENEMLPLPGLMKGTAGIAYFLVVYWQVCGEDHIETAARKALSYLMYDFRMKNGQLVKHKDAPIELFYGISGIALTFLKAYEVFGEQHYLAFAEQLLKIIPPKRIFDNLTINYGITGLGEVYLEAFRVSGNREWMERADYIVTGITHMIMTNEYGGVFWLTSGYYKQRVTADLMIGNAGIVHFLIRYMHPGKFGFPMLS